jgi:hypothetical protein
MYTKNQYTYRRAHKKMDGRKNEFSQVKKKRGNNMDYKLLDYKYKTIF